MLLRNWENLSPAQKGVIRDLEKANKRAFRAWQLKEELRDVMQMAPAKAKQALDDWLYFASRSRLEPFVKPARTIRHYRESIEATNEWGFTNGIAESNNAAIGRIRSPARGFRDPDSFITIIMLARSGIAPSLPWATCPTKPAEDSYYASRERNSKGAQGGLPTIRPALSPLPGGVEAHDSHVHALESG